MTNRLSLLSALVAPALILAWYGPGRLRAWLLPALVVISLYGGTALVIAVRNVLHPGEWDFAAFSLYAKVAHAGANFYVPAVFAQHAAPHMDADFTQEVLNVGFPYPPPSMFLFLPLAALANVHTALALWYAAQFSALAAAAAILRSAFLPKAKADVAFFFGALVLVLAPTFATVYNAQTNFLALALLALAFRARRSSSGAVWSALAVFVKPYALALILGEFAGWRAKRTFAYAATIAGTFAAAFVAFGASTTTTYFTSTPASRAPASSFTEAANQSLLAEIVRGSGRMPAHVTPAHEPLYLVLACALVVSTALLAARLGSDNDDVSFAAALTAGLLVYPATLSSYGVVLVIPLAVLLTRRDTFVRGTYVVAALSCAMCLLLALGHAFWAVALIWTALMVAGFTRQPAR